MSERKIKRRKPKEKRKDLFIRARVTEEQKQLVQDAADHAGITASAWMVATLLRMAREELDRK